MYFESSENQSTDKQFHQHNNIRYLQGNGETILVIDNDTSMRGFLREILTINGYRVLTAQNSRQARSIYRNNTDRIELILMDMQTEHKEQFVAYMVRNEMRPMVLYTDKPFPAREQRTIKGISVIEKPFDVYELFNLIKLKIEGVNLV